MDLTRFPPHWTIRRGSRWLADELRGLTVSAPWPLAQNFCMKTEAEQVCERLNATQAPETEPWQVEPLDLAAILADEQQVHRPVGRELEAA